MGDYTGDYSGIQGNIIKVIQWDTRSFDYSSNGVSHMRLGSMGFGMRVFGILAV